MDIFEDEEETKCKSRYINLLRRKRNIQDELWQEYINNGKEIDDDEEE